MQETIIKIDNVTKEYRLGAIGGGTLKGDLQSWVARKKGKEDPNSKIGSKHYDGNVRFKALDGISFEVKKGEALGIIGHNGAGKSTLLKLLSRVTAPSSGTISYNGRIASMLEVGTGFHPELTGRENVYMNGAILGMTKAEISKKFDDIVKFAEMEKFIDTPVKRYSSGMYVKLAFSVAAHLDSEIMIMDEVLAVGDMAFQKKCLDKMRDAAHLQGRTVLYVSHNMNTIRALCSRCIVLSQGKVVFDGDVEKAIEVYMDKYISLSSKNDVSALPRELPGDGTIRINQIEMLDASYPIAPDSGNLNVNFTIDSKRDCKNLMFKSIIVSSQSVRVGTASTSSYFSIKKGRNTVNFDLDVSALSPNDYFAIIIMYELDQHGCLIPQDCVDPAFSFRKESMKEDGISVQWKSIFGNSKLAPITVNGVQSDK